MRSTKALISTGVAIILQIISIISALVIPRLIIGTYGSTVNGLVQSITQFLGYISLLQLGVGGVIRASLYKPLAEHDNYSISRVMKASELFFRKVGLLSCIYVLILSFLFPIVSHTEFSFSYVVWLIIVIGASTIVQYMVGFPAKLLIMADQRAYFFDFVQIVAIILNIAFTVLLIKMNCSIQVVKLVSSIVFIVQPIVLSIYVNKRYSINKKVTADNTSIEQRWAGMSYSLADFVHRKTDVFVLTLLSTLQEVSVYSVYTVITNGINSIIMMATNSFQAALGDMIAKNEKAIIDNTMSIYIFVVHFVSTIVFSVAIVMITPFVSLYTHGIADVSYTRTVFAVLILLAELLYCLRQPYQSVVIAAGKFRETQKGAIIEAILNIVISVFLVRRYGIVGVAVGTLVAMGYRTIDLVKYLSNNIINYKYKEFIRRYAVTGGTIIFTSVLMFQITPTILNVWSWLVWALIATVIATAICVVVNMIICKKEFVMFLNKLGQVLKHLLRKV